jgi:hypothetical protein
MTTPAVRIALPKLFLWSEAARVQEYPEALARGVAERGYTRSEIERELFDVAPTMRFQHGSPRGSRTDGIVNLYGLERSRDRWRLNGIGLLDRHAGRATLTADGLRLGALYREEPRGDAWARELARLIAQREPRTRLILWLMLRGAELRAGSSDADARFPIELRLPDAGVLAIRWTGSDDFNRLLQAHATELLGAHWARVLGPEAGRTVVWEGVEHERPPSTNGLSTALRRSLGLLQHLGVFEGSAGSWLLSQAQLGRTLGGDIAPSLGVESAAPMPPGDDEAFARALSDCADAEGFLVVSRLSDRFGELLDVPIEDRPAVFDSYVRAAMYHDRLRVLDRHPGQPRMGRGLFGEPTARRIRIELAPVRNNSQAHSAEQTRAGSSNDVQGENQ